MSTKSRLKKTQEPGHPDMDLGVLENNVGYYMRKAVLASQSSFLKESGVKLMTGQYAVMEIISQNPGRTQSAIAWTAGLDRSSLVPILSQFEQNGFITREAVEADKRAYAVSLTEKGAAELAQLRIKIVAMEDRFISGMGAKSHQQLIILLKKFMTTL